MVVSLPSASPRPAPPPVPSWALRLRSCWAERSATPPMGWPGQGADGGWGNAWPSPLSGEGSSQTRTPRAICCNFSSRCSIVVKAGQWHSILDELVSSYIFYVIFMGFPPRMDFSFARYPMSSCAVTGLLWQKNPHRKSPHVHTSVSFLSRSSFRSLPPEAGGSVWGTALGSATAHNPLLLPFSAAPGSPPLTPWVQYFSIITVAAYAVTVGSVIQVCPLSSEAPVNPRLFVKCERELINPFVSPGKNQTRR